MANIIRNPVIYSEDLESLMASTQSSEGFSHTSWSIADLQVLRVHVRNHYRIQQQGICAYCRQRVSLKSAANCHVEHIAPKSKYPQFMFEPKNLCVACADCNEIKKEQETMGEEPDPICNGDDRVRYPRAASSFYIVHPHFDDYDEHIEIFNGHYVDKTDKGHFTIGACKLNRRLRAFGWEETLISEPELNCLMTDFLGADDAIVKNEKLQSIKRALVKVS
ncbi:HNH endonuclease [Photobacterium leiognathi]|uniref:HNH endonuclease n=1 Tax=Photobacterium leiognathi TaxID=553611 RepID=UPI002980BBDB|nr:HNH endonuclease [Photobacterium leiognathi]